MTSVVGLFFVYQEAQMQSFELQLDLVKSVAGSPGQMRVGGVATDESIDLDTEITLLNGIKDSLEYLKSWGKFNDNHSKKLIGEVNQAEIVTKQQLIDRGYFNAEDVAHADRLKKCLYVEGFLYPKVKEAQNYHKALESGARIGMSLQGRILQRSVINKGGEPILTNSRVFCNQIAITGEPKNANTSLRLLKGLNPPDHPCNGGCETCTDCIQQEIKHERHDTLAMEKSLGALRTGESGDAPLVKSATSRRRADDAQSRSGKLYQTIKHDDNNVVHFYTSSSPKVAADDFAHSRGTKASHDTNGSAVTTHPRPGVRHTHIFQTPQVANRAGQHPEVYEKSQASSGIAKVKMNRQVNAFNATAAPTAGAASGAGLINTTPEQETYTPRKTAFGITPGSVKARISTTSKKFRPTGGDVMAKGAECMTTGAGIVTEGAGEPGDAGSVRTQSIERAKRRRRRSQGQAEGVKLEKAVGMGVHPAAGQSFKASKPPAVPPMPGASGQSADSGMKHFPSQGASHPVAKRIPGAFHLGTGIGGGSHIQEFAHDNPVGAATMRAGHMKAAGVKNVSVKQFGSGAMAIGTMAGKTHVAHFTSPTMLRQKGVIKSLEADIGVTLSKGTATPSHEDIHAALRAEGIRHVGSDGDMHFYYGPHPLGGTKETPFIRSILAMGGGRYYQYPTKAEAERKLARFKTSGENPGQRRL